MSTRTSLGMTSLGARLGFKCAALAAVVAGCTPSTSTMTTTPTGNVVQFAPLSTGASSLANMPWPSDLYLDASGHIAISSLAPLPLSPAHPLVIADLATRDGFSVTSGAFFALSQPLDPAANLDGLVRLLDLDGGPDVPVTIAYRGGGDQLLHARPQNGHVLIQKHHYAYIVTLQPGSPALVASTDFSTLMAATSAPSDPRLAPAFTATALLRNRIAQPVAGDVAASTIVGAAVFTTQSVTATVEATRALVQTQTPVARVGRVYAVAPVAGMSGSLDDLMGTPTSLRPGTDNPGGLAHDGEGWVIQGTFAAPNFLSATTAPSDGLTVTKSQLGRFTTATSLGTAAIPFTLVLPKMPQGGSFANLPLVIFAHGLGDQRKAVLALANTIAKSGMATIGIDIPFHGMRQPDAVDVLTNVTGKMVPDGFADSDNFSSVNDFMDVGGDAAHGIAAIDPAVIRSNFQQSATDLIAEVQLITSGALDTLASADPALAKLTFRKDSIFLSGESFGSLLSAIVLGVEPKVGASTLSVGGGGLVFPLLSWSVVYGPIFGILLDSGLGTDDSLGDPESDFGHNLVQFLLEAGDPLAFAPYVISQPLAGSAPRHVLMLNDYLDESVPNISNQALAAAMGLGYAKMQASGTPHFAYTIPAPTVMAAPVMGNVTVAGKPSQTVTAAIVEFETATHPMITEQTGLRTSNPLARPFVKLSAPVTIQNPIEALQDTLTSFATDFYAGKMPVLIDHQ